MGTIAIAHHAAMVPPAPPPTSRHVGLAAFTGLVSLSAWAGAAGLAFGFLGLPAYLERRLPFHSPVLGGVALALIVAVPMAIVAVLALAGDPRTGQAAMGAGVLQVGWIVVQLAFIRELSFFHPTFLVAGIVLVLWGRHLDRTTTGSISPASADRA